MANLRTMTEEQIKTMWQAEPARVTKGRNKGVMTAEAIAERDAIIREWRRRGLHMFDLG